MNYYRRYVGDYLRDTARLSMLEHGAYNLLLDYYYAEERPIPGEPTEVYRMVRALMPEERRAVDKVLTLYFRKADDGWRHKRVDTEISTAQACIEKQRASGVESATKRWSKDRLTDGSVDGSTHIVTHDPSIQPPTTNHQPPSASHQPKRKSAVGLAPDLKLKALEVLTFLNTKAGKNYKPVPSNLQLIAALLREGASVDDMRAVIAKKCREWHGKPDMDKYLRPATLFGPKNFWTKYEGELAPPVEAV